MDGIRNGNTTLFLGHLPGRKSLCFYFETDNVLYPVAYVQGRYTNIATKRWRKLLSSNNTSE